MNKNLKAYTTLFVLLLTVLSLSTVTSADSDLYDITKVKVNGIEMSDSTTSQVELDDPTEIEVYIEGTGNSSTCPGNDVDDCAVEVHVKVWIGGYEYDDIEATSEEFDIEPGVSYKKTLMLDIPEDLDIEDDGEQDNDYTLYVEVYDNEDSERKSYDLFAERPSHSLNIVDVIYDSSLTTGEKTLIEVRVENLGEEKEEDIKVAASLGGATAADYIDELAAFEEKNEDEESSDSAKMVLTVPEDLSSGYYDLTIEVTYNRGHDTIEETYTVWVSGEGGEETDAEDEDEEDREAKTTISLGSTSLKGTEGEETSFTMTFTNTGTGTATYSVVISGEEQWASSNVSPSTITVSEGDSETVTVTLTVDGDATGSHDFNVQVLNDDGTLLEEVDITMTVEEDDESYSFGETSKILKIGFIILIVLIIIIALIVAFRKLKDDDEDEPLEPKEGQTYY